MSRPKRALLVANPVARGVTRAMIDVIAKALSADFRLEVFETTGRGSARDAVAEAVAHKTRVVVVFSGDGTVNEVVNGMSGSDAALGLIPGGATNVLVRNLGLPEEPLEATTFQMRRAAEGTARRMSIGSANGRAFVINCGVGMDAALMDQVERARPTSRVAHERAAVVGSLRIARDYVGRKPDLTVKIDDGAVQSVVSVMIARTSPYAYFKSFELRIHPEHAALDGGLEVLTVGRLPATRVPRVAYEIFAGGNLAAQPEFGFVHDATAVEIGAPRPFPVQLDGEYVGEFPGLDVRLVPDALWVLA